jgi:hypothetical protein
MSDFLIAAAIATPLVLVAVLLVLRGAQRATRREAEALASRLRCPRCDLPSLVWAEQVWAVDELHDDREESQSGFTFRCRQCGQAFNFTDEGILFRDPVAGGDSAG